MKRLLLVLLMFSGIHISAQEPCEKEVLLYISKSSGNFDIYLNDLEGNELQLTDNQGMDWSPKWNPDQNVVFYYSYEGDSFMIRSMDMAGNILDYDFRDFEEYNISPDGELLAFQAKENNGTSVVITNVKGDTVDIIQTPGKYNGRAHWSPDSKKLAFISDRDGNNELYIYQLYDQDLLRITNDELAQKYLAWSPDGERLAYTTQYYKEGEADRNELFIADLINGEKQKIIDDQYNDAEISWAPISGRIAFHSTRSDGDQIYVINSDGSGIQPVTYEDTYHGEPTWAIDTSDCR